MTCVVGFEYNNKVWIGADSAGISGDYVSVRADKKVFRNKDYVFGFAGSFRMGQLLQYYFQPPGFFSSKDIDEFMIVDFIPKLKAILTTESEKPNCLIGFRGKLFSVQEDYQVARNVYPYHAIGAGNEPAMGSLFTTYSMDMSVEEKLILALRAAQQFCTAVREPFHIESV